GLQRLLHRLPRDHARRLPLDRTGLGRVDRAEAVERVAERVDDAAEQPGADRHGGDLAGAPHRLALLDQVPLAEQRRTDVLLLEVERQPDDAVLQLEHLEGDTALEPVDAGDAVADLQHRADLGEVGLDVELLDPLLEDRGDLFGAQLHVVQLLAVASSWRRRSSRPRTLASSLSEPAWRTRPPISSASTERVPWTLRPEASSIRPRIRPNSESESSCAVVSSTSRMRASAATSTSSSSAIPPSEAARPFSAIRRTKLTTSSSEPSAMRARMSPFTRESTSGLSSTIRSSS